MNNRRELERQIVEFSHRLHRCGWVANHDGNITVKLEDGRYLATPTAFSKEGIQAEHLIVVDDNANVVSGRMRPFSELALHLYMYRQRPDVRVVMHAHPPTATGLSVAGVGIDTAMMAEPVVSLGREVPLIPYATPKSPEWTLNLSPAILDADAVLMENHGVFTVASDLETAYLRMELVEHLAKIQLVAHQAGGIRQIPKDDIEGLLKARTKAGLGRAGRARA